MTAGPWDHDAMWTPEADEIPKRKTKEREVEALKRPLRQYRLTVVVAERDDCEPIEPDDIELMVAGQLLQGAFMEVLEVTKTGQQESKVAY